MAKDIDVKSQKRFQGISDYPKESSNGQIPDTYYFGRAVNYRDDPQSLTLMPASLKESGSVVTDFLKWADIVPVTLTSFHYGDVGNVYSRTSAGSWANLFTVPASHGNGLAYFSGDDYIYVTSDANISRYGPTQNSPAFTANFLTAQGGIPQNTASLVLASASSMYAHAADSASLSITGNLTLETYFKANSLPAVGSSMTLLGKWDESGALRSYKLDLFGVSGFFGDGSDGSKTISVDTTEAPIDSACTGTAGLQSLSATNVSFAVGQKILIIQMQGTGAGQWETKTIQGYTAGTITLDTPLTNTYVSGAQVLVGKRYTNVTVNSGKTWKPKAWNGTVGGILFFYANGTVTVTGHIVADNTGFRGGQAVNQQTAGWSGEGTTGASLQQTAANGNGGGGGQGQGGGPGSPIGAGGGGGNATSGVTGGAGGGGTGGAGGNSSGATDLTTMTLGGGGGSGGAGDNSGADAGGVGGGIIFINGVTITVTGTITSNGINGTATQAGSNAGSGGGAGGSILLKTQTATLGSGLITASAGTGGITGGWSSANGGNGSVGRIDINYLTSYTGTTTPTINAIQDNTLVTTTTIQARLGISNDGTAFEYLTQNLNTLTTGTWNRLSIAWTASTSTAQFYFNGLYIGQSIGTKTSIHDNASLLYIGANKGASTIVNYFDGLLNDTRIINNVQTAGQIYANLNQQLSVTYAGLQAYYKFNSAYTDATGNSNTLTPVNSPTFSADVPFAAPTTRLDIDTTQNLTGQTYTLLTAISESSNDLLPFTPVNDPQDSVGFYVDTKGTGNWTLTIHDQQNKVVASQTIAAANIPASGFIEFIFATPWRLITNKSYHMHLTVSTGTSNVVTGTTANFSTAEYTSYFGFLVTDTQFHPVHQFQYQPLGGSLTGAEIIGNERYLAVWDGANYLPNFITFPPGWRVRCFAQWRQYLAIGVWRGGNIYDFHQGRIYFWSGYQPAYDFFIDVPEGQINALFGVDSDLYMFAGFRGILLDYKGGYFYNTGNSSSNKLKRMPLLSAADYTEVYPGALNMWRGLLHFGLYANSNSTTAQKGVYSFGTLNQYYPDTLSYDYVISTGNKASTVSIGLVYPVGQNLIIGWKDGSAYGADMVSFSNPPASSGEVDLLIIDDNAIWNQNANFQVKADFEPLKTGESIDTKVSLDRGAFAFSTPDGTVGDMFTKGQVSNGRGREVQFGADLYATGSTSPTLLAISLLRNGLAEEEQF
jgi:hypothetical protein